MTERAPIVTVDGPSGAGKGTICQLLSKHLGWHLLDSGAIYRVLALAAIHHDIELSNEEALTLMAAHLDVQFLTNTDSNAIKVVLEGETVMVGDTDKNTIAPLFGDVVRYELLCRNHYRKKQISAD